jgi:hypothetical protein
LTTLLHKVKTIKAPQPLPIKVNLREFFKTYWKRSKVRYKKKGIPPKYTLFTEPFPYLAVYAEKDESLPMKSIQYTSFRKAQRMYIISLSKYLKAERSKRKASDIT